MTTLDPYERLAAQTADEPEIDVVLGAWRDYLDEQIIPQLPASSEWKWVAMQLRRALDRQAS